MSDAFQYSRVLASKRFEHTADLRSTLHLNASTVDAQTEQSLLLLCCSHYMGQLIHTGSLPVSVSALTVLDVSPQMIK